MGFHGTVVRGAGQNVPPNRDNKFIKQNSQGPLPQPPKNYVVHHGGAAVPLYQQAALMAGKGQVIMQTRSPASVFGKPIGQLSD